MTLTYPLFNDRTDAGKQLARMLVEYATGDVLVLGIPRGGVPVAYEVALYLHAPLDTLVVRKVGAPMNPEFGVGAVAPGDVLVFDDMAIHSLGLTRRDLDSIVEGEIQEMDRRMVQYRSGDYTQHMIADTVILVDDGLATGVSMRAAVESAHILQKPKTLVIATPVCTPKSAHLFRVKNSVVVCVIEPPTMHAVGEWYRTFDQTTDEEVIQCLEKAAHRSPS